MNVSTLVVPDDCPAEEEGADGKIVRARVEVPIVATTDAPGTVPADRKSASDSYEHMHLTVPAERPAEVGLPGGDVAFSGVEEVHSATTVRASENLPAADGAGGRSAKAVMRASTTMVPGNYPVEKPPDGGEVAPAAVEEAQSAIVGTKEDPPQKDAASQTTEYPPKASVPSLDDLIADVYSSKCRVLISVYAARPTIQRRQLPNPSLKLNPDGLDRRNLVLGGTSGGA